MVGQHISKYRITEQVGRGGMGTVYRAVDETLHREVAIKVLNTELNDPSVARRFRAEAVTVARLNHPGIATIYELVQHEGQWLMVMEFVRGETLERLSVRRGALPVAEAADLCVQTLSALAHAHSLGVVHRDLKPANLMVTETGMVKVMDFGIARVAGSEHLTSAGFMMGTPAYMAPEQVLGQEIDARTDLYATGVVLYHLATGRLPFKGDTPLEMAQSRLNDQPTPAKTVRADLPGWLGQVLDIGLAREPERRFQTALLFREALRRGLANLPIETPVPAPPPPELVATAAPRSLPIVTPGPVAVAEEIPRATPPPAADVPTMAGTLPVPPPAGSTGNAFLRVGAAVAVVIVAVGAGVWWRHHRAAEAQAAAPPVAMVVPEPVQTSAPPPVPPPPAPDPGAATTDTGRASEAASPVAPAVAPTPGPAPAQPAASSPAAAPSAAAPTEGRAAAPSRPARGRGRAAVANDPTVEFSDLRALLVDGKKADEESASLRFQAGQIMLVADKGDRVYASMPYSEVTSAAFVRAKNPRWFPTLAGPPSDVDMPGGLFRASRGWLSLQSRNSYLIVRLNDSDLHRVLDTVTERTGVKIQQLDPQ